MRTRIIRGVIGPVATAACFVSLVVATAATASSRTGADGAINLPVTPKLQGELLRAFLRDNPDLTPAQVVGPLIGKRCRSTPAGRECGRFRIHYARYRGYEWAEAKFWLVDNDPDEADGNAKRRVGGAWRWHGGYASEPPPPCPVRRVWGRKC
jgi:hypothetical protein